MALDILPVIKHAVDAASYSDTAAPYLAPSYLLKTLSVALKQSPIDTYLTTNPLTTSFILANAFSVVVLVGSEITGDHSWVDRLWSLIPPVYIIHFTLFAHLAGIDTARLDMLCTISVIWGVRLTYNFARKGGYTSGGEDYRWEVIRQKLFPKRWQMTIFNITFIAWYQNMLLWAVSTPAYVFLLLGQLSEKESWVAQVTRPDMVFGYALILAILLETVADQQQWEFQTAKRKYQKTKVLPANSRFSIAELDRGFLTQGLFGVSRHPNFLAEQLVWVGVYQWSVWMSDSLFAWTAVGAVGYLGLFQGSTVFTEWITAGKYKEYKEYQKKVPKFLPGFTAIMGGVPEIKLGEAEEKKKKDEDVTVGKKGKGGKRK